MKLNDWDMFRLEDRVLFEAAAAAEIVDAAEAAQDNPNAECERKRKIRRRREREALKNAPPETVARRVRTASHRIFPANPPESTRSWIS